MVSFSHCGWVTIPPAVFISSPKAIQEIFTAQPDQFEVGKSNGILQPLVGDDSLVLLDGDRHQRQRRLLMPPFHGERMRIYGKLICDITEKVISQWAIGKSFSPRSFMQEISLRTILHAVFGLKEGQRYLELQQRFSSLLDVTASPLSSSLLFSRHCNKI